MVTLSGSDNLASQLEGSMVIYIYMYSDLWRDVVSGRIYGILSDVTNICPPLQIR